jgi:hypothetical protein
VRIDLDRHDSSRGSGKPLGEHPQPGANFQDVLVWRELRRAHNRRRRRLILEERLAQTLRRPKPEGA